METAVFSPTASVLTSKEQMKSNFVDSKHLFLHGGCRGCWTASKEAHCLQKCIAFELEP